LAEESGPSLASFSRSTTSISSSARASACSMH
jgi:hypothetical protein